MHAHVHTYAIHIYMFYCLFKYMNVKENAVKVNNWAR